MTVTSQCHGHGEPAVGAKIAGLFPDSELEGQVKIPTTSEQWYSRISCYRYIECLNSAVSKISFMPVQ